MGPFIPSFSERCRIRDHQNRRRDNLLQIAASTPEIKPPALRCPSFT